MYSRMSRCWDRPDPGPTYHVVALRVRLPLAPNKLPQVYHRWAQGFPSSQLLEGQHVAFCSANDLNVAYVSL
jgi:hypothetical protein